MYGAQAHFAPKDFNMVFENDVEMYGAQALLHMIQRRHLFENDVEMYGAQAKHLKKSKKKMV